MGGDARSDTVITASQIEEALRGMNRLEDTLNEMTFVAAKELRKAVEVFNATPISVSAVDQFRERVLQIADTLAVPLRERPPVEDAGHSLRVVHTLRSVS